VREKGGGRRRREKKKEEKGKGREVEENKFKGKIMYKCGFFKL
jgi:hypothetical protein